ncbi:MAG: hypothetical protein M1823_003141 [Watsoniomyces obsoletus]|nr:MAG: hypothetical protein M1823_003141 [Watsoniomyces obsoletus]
MRARFTRLCLIALIIVVVFLATLLHGTRESLTNIPSIRHLAKDAEYEAARLRTALLSKSFPRFSSSSKAVTTPWPPSKRASFQLLIPATEKNPQLCKTLLSAMVLQYPPPTLINFKKKFQERGLAHGSHVGKLQGILDHLSNEKMTHADDVVLVVDGYDVWFQLPPEVLLQRYHQLLEKANTRLEKEYDRMTEVPWRSEELIDTPEPRFVQKIVYGTDKHCWPNKPQDPACAALPGSTLPDDAWGDQTDKEAMGWHNRPKYLNSGAVIGPAADLKALYETAVWKVEKQHRGGFGDQFVLAEIFGEQEVHRRRVKEAKKDRRVASGGEKGNVKSTDDSNITSSSVPINDHHKKHASDTKHPRQLEYTIGLDYEMSLFQTMTHSHPDIEFLTFNDTERVSSILSSFSSRHRHTTQENLLADLKTIPSPFHSLTSSGPITLHTKPKPPPHDSTLEKNKNNGNMTWSSLPLAVNIHVPSIPALLHFNGDKSYLDTWWPRMWFHPFARELLKHRVIHHPELAAHDKARSGKKDGRNVDASLEGGGITTAGGWAGSGVGGGEGSRTRNGDSKDKDRSRWNSPQGGWGGVWTDTGEWFTWRDLCKGYEEEVFSDGRGRWGREDDGEGDAGGQGGGKKGDGKTYNEMGKVITDDEVGV